MRWLATAMVDPTGDAPRPAGGAVGAPTPPRLAALVDRGGLVALVAFVLYAWLAPAYPLGGDNGEFTTLGTLGGVPHPSGYPLYLMWLRAWSWLPASTPAHAMALATAILGGLQILVLHAACRGWGARPATATVAVALFAGGPLALLLNSQAEVFALNALIAATVLWLAAPAGPLRGVKRGAALGLVAGLGIANHMTCVLLAPVGIAGVVVAVREAPAGLAPRLRVIALAALGLGLGLLPYLYLLVAPATALSWGRIDSFADLLHHVLRADYGTGSLSAHGVDIPLSVNLPPLVANVGRCYWYVPAAGGVAMLVWRAVRGPSRAMWICLLASVVLAGPVFIGMFDQPPVGVWAWMTERFHFLPCVLLAVPVAAGLDAMVTLLAKHRPALAARAAARERGIGVLLVVLVPAAAAPSLDHVRRAHTPAVDRFARNLLRALPEGAVVIASGDDVYFGVGYAQLVDKLRPDVHHIALELMTLPWYQQQTSARLGFDAVKLPGEDFASVKLAEAVLARGVPLFVDTRQRYILAALPSYPYGPVIRVLPRGAVAPGLDEVRAINQKLVEGYDLAYPRPDRTDGWAAVVHLRYARPWTTLADAFEQLGRTEDAAEARGIAAALAPR
jgi:hypothetical protein